jgi:hypothetical protein
MVNKYHVDQSIPDVTEEYIIEKADELYNEYHNKYKITPEEDSELLMAKEIVQSISVGYWDKYVVIGFPTPVFVEKILSYPIIDGVDLTGKIDEFVDYKDNDFLYEIKSTRSITSDYIQKYHMDPQTLTYLILCETNGYETNRIMLDLIKKPGIRQGKNESEASFFKRLMDLYQDLENNFTRESYIISDQIIKKHYRSIKEDCKIIGDLINMSLKKSDKLCTHNYNWCYVYSPCQFVPLCRDGENNMTLAMYRNKTSRNEELEEN